MFHLADRDASGRIKVKPRENKAKGNNLAGSITSKNLVIYIYRNELDGTFPYQVNFHDSIYFSMFHL
jgi:predicted acyltransferase (DUF342 family)